MRKTICASVLVLALCGSAFAGDMECPPIAPGDISSPPASTAGDMDTAPLAAGDINNPPGTTQSPDNQTASVLAEAALSVLNSVLALL
jgi:hypothetical protein